MTAMTTITHWIVVRPEGRSDWTVAMLPPRAARPAPRIYYESMQVLPSPSSDAELAARAGASRVALDAWVREVVAWHFDPASGSPFWLEYATKLGWDPRREINGFADLGRFPPFED